MNIEQVIIFEAPKIEPPELRLYYDDQGKVICYSCDKTLQGNYIVVDAQTYAEGRPDVKVIDGEICRAQPEQVVFKLMPNEHEGKNCHPEDVSVIVTTNTKSTKWKLTNYELR